MITIIKFFIGLSLIVINANAYTPARPVNSSQGTIENGANATDSFKLQLNWFPNGSYTQNVAYRLAGVGSLGINEGAFVRFSESNVNKTTSPATTPWIALISCDFNSTNVSLEEDIFTLARGEGAIAALLFSVYSQSCVINGGYLRTSDPSFDVFSTQSPAGARLTEYQLQLPGIESDYDAGRLNELAFDVQRAIQQGVPDVPGFLFATIKGQNTTGIDAPPSNVTDTGTNAAPATPSNSSSSNGSLKTAVPYTTIGCAFALLWFAVMSGRVH